MSEGDSMETKNKYKDNMNEYTEKEEDLGLQEFLSLTRNGQRL